MIEKNIIVCNPRIVNLRLRAMREIDQENLRCWKNSHKESFFLKDDITAEQQNAWYKSMQSRADDVMFIVEQQDGSDWVSIGCMGFRVLDDEKCIDAYNIIRGTRMNDPSFTMSDAFKTMLAFANREFPSMPIRVKVLANNPAIQWYEKNGFITTTAYPDHVVMEMNKTALSGIEIGIEQQQL